MLKLIALVVITASTLSGVEVPQWVLKGILYVETCSNYDGVKYINYRDKRRGSSGERGPFQLTRGAFNQIKCRGEQFWQVETDVRYAEEMTKRYLLWNYKGDWYAAIEAYNAGPGKHSPKYLNAVITAGAK